MLSGDGGDEAFGGYTGRYRVAALKAAMPKPCWLASGLRCLPPWRSGWRRSLPEMLDLATLPDEERYVVERQITSASDRAALFGYFRMAEDALREIPARPLAIACQWHPVHRALWMDLMTSLPNDMLTKVDRMSMAHGLEVRVPFLDHELVEFALSMPPSWLVSPWPVEGKRLLRHTVEPLLGENVIKRTKKGFVIPLNSWLSKYFLPIFDDLCLDRKAYINSFIDRKEITKLRYRPFSERPREDLYALLVLELWLRRMNRG